MKGKKSGKKLGNTVTHVDEENKKSTHWNYGCLEICEGKISSLHWLPLAAYDKT